MRRSRHEARRTGGVVLIVVRHGRTEANAAGRLLGRLDVDLDDVGRAQAAALARSLESVERVVTSPLRRARATAAAIAARVGVDVEVDDRWIELDYGTLDGSLLAEVPAETWSRWRADPHFVPGGGESLVALGARVREACDALAGEASSASGGDTVVVTHVSPIKAAVAWALGVGDEVAWRLFVAPASVTRIDLRRGALVGFNDVAHLPLD